MKNNLSKSVQLNKKIDRYGKLLLLSASPVGDHVVLLDMAHRFYKSNNIKSVIFIKKNFKFLSELGAGYGSYTEFVNFESLSGKLKFIYYFLNSIYKKNILVYFFPIVYKKYLKLIGDIFNHFTRAVVVSLEYNGLEHLIPSGVHIKADINSKYYFEQENDILKVLNLKEDESMPEFQLIENKDSLKRFKGKDSNGESFNLHDTKYLVIHPTPSRPERRIGLEKWQEVFSYAKKNNLKIAFTGIKKDEVYIDELSQDLDSTSFIKIISPTALELLNVFYFAEEYYGVHTGPAHIAAAMHKKGKIFCHLWLKQFDMSYSNLEIEKLSEVRDAVSLNLDLNPNSENLIFKKRYNTWQVGAGRLGDFLCHLDFAKRKYEVDGSMSKIILMSNFDFLSKISESEKYVKVYKLSTSTILKSFFDFLFAGFYFVWLEPVNPDDFSRRKALKYLIRIYVCLVFIFSRGRVLIHRDDGKAFAFLSKKNIFESVRGEHMFYENNIKIVEKMTSRDIENRAINFLPNLSIKKDEVKIKEIREKLNIRQDESYIVLNITASEKFKYCSHTLWSEVFENVISDLSGKKEKSVFYKKRFVLTGEPKDKDYLDKVFINLDLKAKDLFVRCEGGLSIRENIDLLMGASGLVTMRTGSGTLATMLSIDYRVLAIMPFKCHNWDYDYYPNLKVLHRDDVCKCAEYDHISCRKMYDDGVERVMCIGEIRAEMLYNEMCNMNKI